jgi:uncharacterized protein YbjT (DUF2867 family)
VRVVLFGATGMIGQGVLRECLIAPDVEAVLSVARSPTGTTHPKLRELQPPDFFDLTAVAQELRGFDACFFCLGMTSAGMSEADYRRVTYDIAMAAGGTLARLNPGMTFVFVSGAGADSTERGRLMWARVKGQTENAILKLPFRRAVVFRPGIILPKYGAASKTKWVRVAYNITRPLWPVLFALLPRHVTTTERIGLAMLRVARHGAPKAVLEMPDITALSRAEG